jgi:SNF2 family DNA or RNA helicase
MIFKPHPYQSAAIQFMVKHKAVGLLADPGLGKTATTLQVIKTLKLIKPDLRVLIVAPLRVVYSVWQQEIAKWGLGFTSTKLHGKDKAVNLSKSKDIYLINPEGLKWLLDTKFKADILVIDESSKFKSAKSKRFKLLKKNLDRFDRRYILTGTPTPKSLEDLWSQVYILDKGEALGKFVTHYRNKYFYPTGFKNYQYELKPGAEKTIYDRVAPLVMRIDAATHLDLPDLVFNRIDVELPAAAKKVYNDLKKVLVAEIEGATHIVPTLAAAYGVCCQVANGAIYDQEADGLVLRTLDTYTDVHDEKIKALQDLIDELQGKPVLVAYRFKHDLARLRKALGKDVPYIGGGVTAKRSTSIVDDWNKGRIPVLLGNPQSMAHGLNMQAGGNDVVWFGLTDNYEDYDQFNRRVFRQGVKGQVRLHHLVAKGTVDEIILKRCESKSARQEDLFEALKRWRTKQM